MAIRPWREIAEPHRDVREGRFKQSEFAADLTAVHKGTAPDEYRKPDLFFSRTYITEGMKLLLDSVIRRLSGQGGDPVIQLQTAFGGGKTHTMLAVYHVAKGEVPISNMQGIPQIVDASGIFEVPKAKLVVIDGTDISPSQPIIRNQTPVHTLWGDLAWQLGGAEAYEMVREADVEGTSPGKAVLIDLLTRYSPCVILMDEMVAYLRQFEEGRYSGGTFDSNLTFIQALTEAVKVVPTAMVLASLPQSQTELGGERGQQALNALEKYVGRVHAVWKPVATEEAFEIVRRRLFSSIRDTHAVEEVCREYANFYIQNSNAFPPQTQESRYFERLKRSYPIHPEVFDRLYEDWSTLDKFQRTRGVLQLMAKVIHKLWAEGNTSFLIQPSDLPLYDVDARNAIVHYLPQGWDPVLDRDVDGGGAETTQIDKEVPRFGSYQAARRVGRTVFLGSAPSSTLHGYRGIDTSHILLGCVRPGDNISVYQDALQRMLNKLHYLNESNGRYYYDTRPNLRREMEERKTRFTRDDDDEEIYRRMGQWLKNKGQFDGIHPFVSAIEVPDDEALRLVVLSPKSAFSRNEQQNEAVSFAKDVLQTRGDKPRTNQNRLVFLAPEFDSVRRLREQVRTYLSWKSIIDDIEGERLNMDRNQENQARSQIAQSQKVVEKTLRDTYKWLLVPYQEAQPGKVQPIKLEEKTIPADTKDTLDAIFQLLKDDEAVVVEWASIHLANELRRWFWKEEKPDVVAQEFWQKSCQYVYLPRLRNAQVLVRSIEQGVEKGQFGLASRQNEERYEAFAFGERASATLDVLLIEPSKSESYKESLLSPVPPVEPPKTSGGGGGTDSVPSMPGPSNVRAIGPNRGGGHVPPVPVQERQKRRYYGSVLLHQHMAKMEFGDVFDELIKILNDCPNAKVNIRVSIEAEFEKGFDETIQRTIRENGNSLGFLENDFEE